MREKSNTSSDAATSTNRHPTRTAAAIAALLATASVTLAGELVVNHQAFTSSGNDATTAGVGATAFTIGSDENIVVDNRGTIAVSFAAGAIARYGSGRVSAAVIGSTDRVPSQVDRQATSSLFANDTIQFTRAPDDPSGEPITVTFTCDVFPLDANLSLGSGTNNAIGPGGSASVSVFGNATAPSQAGSSLFALNDAFNQLVGGTFTQTFDIQPGGEIQYILNLSAIARIGINDVDRRFGQDGRYFGYTITVQSEPGTLQASESGHDYTSTIEPPAFPCGPADVAAPIGILDLEDIAAFINAFNASDPLADLTDDDLIDLDDISAFVTSFTAGCP